MNNKYFLELNLNGVIQIDPSRRDEIVKKATKLIQAMFKGENVIQLSSDVNLVSDESIYYSMAVASSASDEDFEMEN